MKLVKVTTKHTQDEIQNIASFADPTQLQILEKIYSKFEYVEFVDENKMVSMFCIVDDYTIKDLVKNYVNLSIDFSFEDLTKDAFLCNDIKTNFLGDDDIDMTGVIEGRDRVYYAMGKDELFDHKVMEWVNVVRKKVRSGAHSPGEFQVLDHLLHGTFMCPHRNLTRLSHQI